VRKLQETEKCQVIDIISKINDFNRKLFVLLPVVSYTPPLGGGNWKLKFFGVSLDRAPWTG